MMPRSRKLSHVMTRILALILVLAAATPALAEPTAEQWGVVMNLSGRQRMLTQKMSKEFLLVALGAEAQANQQALAGTVALFEKTLHGLRDGDTETNLPATQNERIVKQLDKVRTMFDELKPVFDAAAGGAKPGDADIRAVAEKSVPLLTEMNKAVKMYEREAKDVLGGDAALAVVINLAGRQRMLTQKMSKEFLLVALNIDTENNRLNLRETASLFDQTLKGLIDGDKDLELPGTTDPQARAQLLVVSDLWGKFQPNLANGLNEGGAISASDIQAVAAGNMPLLKNMNDAVKLFEQQANASKMAGAQ